MKPLSLRPADSAHPARGTTKSRKSNLLAATALLILTALLASGCFRITYLFSVLDSEETETKITTTLEPEAFPNLFRDSDLIRDNTDRAFLDNLSLFRSQILSLDNAIEILGYLDALSLETMSYLDENGWLVFEFDANSPILVPENLSNFLAEILSSSISPSLRELLNLGSLAELTETGGGWEYSLNPLKIVLESSIDFGIFSDSPEQQGNSGQNFLQLLADFSQFLDEQELDEGATAPAIFFSVRLPGELVSTNAPDAVTEDGYTTATWQILPLENLQTLLIEGIVLETSTSDNSFPVWLILVLVAIAIVLVLVLVPRKYLRQLFVGRPGEPQSQTVIHLPDPSTENGNGVIFTDSSMVETESNVGNGNEDEEGSAEDGDHPKDSNSIDDNEQPENSSPTEDDNHPYSPREEL